MKKQNKSKMESKAIAVLSAIVESEVQKNSREWPPLCAGIFHQPKRPKQKQSGLSEIVISGYKYEEREWGYKIEI